MADDNNPLKWISDKILREEPLPRGPDFSEPLPETHPEPVAVPIDLAAEQQAFADLLTKLAETDEGDMDTHVTILSADQFAADAFTPTNPPKEPQS